MKTPRCQLLSAILGLAACLPLSGCLIPDIHYARNPVRSDTKGFSAIRQGVTTRGDVISTFGQPDEFYSELDTACYRLNELTRYRLWLALGFLPVSMTTLDDKTEVAFILFDQRDIVERCAIRKVWGSGDFKSEAQEWLRAQR